MNKATPNVKVVRLEDLRAKVNENLDEVEIKNFFPGAIFSLKDWCSEKDDISSGETAIKQIFTKLTEMKNKLLENDDDDKMIILKKPSKKSLD